MRRLFDEHILRKTVSLDGFWNFKTDEKDIGKEEKWFKGLENSVIASVPSVWNIESGLLSYEGVAWYQKKVHLEKGTAKLCFDAVLTEADVWFDNDYLGYHYGGFSEFGFIINNIEEGYHTVTVRVRNIFDKQSIPQEKVDWYHYGGITRSVRIEYLKGISILSNRFKYTLNDDLTKANCYFEAEIYNAEDKEISDKIEFYLGNKKVYSENITLKPFETKTILSKEFFEENIRLWDEGKPELYDIKVLSSCDDLLDRTGFRKIEVKNSKIFLNGREIELRGVNRHEEHPEFGFAFPQSLMKRDIDIILDLGCNTIRGSHYPNSKAFVDMLDSYGILFWSEIPIWGGGFSQEALGDDVVVNRGLEMHREMLEFYYNHPSIIIWGMHNEILTATDEALQMTKKYYSFLKENGGNRIVTYATDKPMDDICLEYCDVISINQYFGWYYGDKHSWDEFLVDFEERREKLGLSDIPVIMSEFGCAAIYGEHTFDNIHWTEEYQAELLSYCVNAFHNHPMMAGFYIWQYCDMRTCLQAGLNRARGFNNKGIVNEYRKPKAAYFAIKKDYNSFK